jgi:hypothetical protein
MEIVYAYSAAVWDDELPAGVQTDHPYPVVSPHLCRPTWVLFSAAESKTWIQWQVQVLPVPAMPYLDAERQIVPITARQLADAVTHTVRKFGQKVPVAYRACREFDSLPAGHPLKADIDFYRQLPEWLLFQPFSLRIFTDDRGREIIASPQFSLNRPPQTDTAVRDVHPLVEAELRHCPDEPGVEQVAAMVSRWWEYGSAARLPVAGNSAL